MTAMNADGTDGNPTMSSGTQWLDRGHEPMTAGMNAAGTDVNPTMSNWKQWLDRGRGRMTANVLAAPVVVVVFRQ